MSSVKWTLDQQKVIDLRDRNILVSAAAGSGKTAVLVERIITMITDKEHPVDIDHLLIVTFTNAAASEMRDRISKAVEKKLKEDPDDSNLQKQMALIHSAQITTIHSFCLHVIRNYFNVIDLDPSFRIAEEAELKLLQSEVAANLLEKGYEELRPEFIELVESYATGKTDQNLEDLILQLYHFSISYPWPLDWLEEGKKAFEVTTLEELEESKWMSILKDYLHAMLADMKEELEDAVRICLQPDGPYMYLPNLEAEMDMITGICQKETYEEFLEGFSNITFGRLSGKRDSAVSTEKKEVVKKKRDRIKKLLSDMKENYFFQPIEEMLVDIAGARASMHELIDLTIAFSAEYKALKEEKGVVDFNDLEHFALNILVEKGEDGTILPSAVAKELSEFYDEILIDEYQDSNLVQEMILTNISKERMGRPNVFMVGDVKQSIYKFRMARPELFMHKYNTYSLEDSKAQRIDLHKNFRSREVVLTPINYIFEKIMTEKLGGITYDDRAALHVGANFEDGEHTSKDTELLLVGELSQLSKEEEEALANMTQALGYEEDDTEENIAGLSDFTTKELEAKAIAKRIKELMDEETGLKLTTGEKDEEGNPMFRPVRLSDIVILFRSMSGWSDVFVDVLLSEGINAYADTQSGYFSTIEIRTILNVLKVIDNPRQEIPLAAVLHSPMFGLSSEELALLKIKQKQVELYDNVFYYAEEGENEELVQKVKRFFSFLEEYRSKVSYTPIYELIRQILEDTKYGYYVQAMPAGERRMGNINMLIQQAIDFEHTSFSGLFDFNRYIEKLEKYEIDYGEASTSNESDEAVRIMSIHKSKGLEFPVVFVAGMGKGMNNQDARSKLVLHADLGLGPDYIDKKYRIKSPTLMKKVIQRTVVLENQAEELRVLYVALTRAKEKLIMTGYMKNFSDKIEELAQPVSERKTLSYQMLTGASSYLDWVIEAMRPHPAFQKEVQRVLPVDIDHESLSGGDVQEQVPFAVRFVDVLEVLHQEVESSVLRELNKEELLEFDCEKVYEETLHQEVKKRLSFVYPYVADTQIRSKVTVSELKKLSMQPEEEDSVPLAEITQVSLEDVEITKVIPNFMREQETSVPMQGSEVGTLYHRLFEKMNMKRSYELEDLHVLLESFVNRNILSPEEFGVIKPEKILHFLHSELGSRVRQAAMKETLHREQQFVIGQPAHTIHSKYQSEEMILVQGIIDLYFEEEDEIVLVDYKTDVVPNEKILGKRYATQLGYYKKALEQMTHKKVKEVYIYSLYLEKTVPIHV